MKSLWLELNRAPIVARGPGKYYAGCGGSLSRHADRLHPREPCQPHRADAREGRDAIRSEADTIEKIIDEMKLVRRSERENRIIDHDQEGSMEIKKREGYF